MPGYYRQFPDQSSPLAYELPEQRYLAQSPPQGPAQQGPYQPALPVQGTDNPLAEVEGLTDAYYDTYGKLKAYTSSMWKDYGIDVTQPNIDQPGGGVPFKSYQKLEAALMSTANRLSNRQKEITQMRPYEATGQVTQPKPGQYETQALLPEVQDILKKLDGPFYNQTEADRAKERLVGPMLQKLIQRGDLNDPLVRHNIEVLKGAGTTYTTYPGLYKTSEDAATKARVKALAGASREIGAVKRFTSLKNGFWEPGSYQIEQDAATGNPQYVNKAHEGEMYGKETVTDASRGDLVGKQVPRIIDGWVRTPDKKVLLTFKPDPESGYTPKPIRVDNVDGADITTQFQQSNNKFGQAQPTFQAIDILGWSDPNNVGTLNEQSMYNAENPQGFEQLSGTRNTMDANLDSRVQKYTNLRKQLTTLIDNGGVFNKQKTELPLPDGSTVKIETNRTNDNLTVDGKEMTLQETEKYLADKGYFEGAQSSGGAISPEEFNSKWSTLKPGETLVGPDGKTYTKK